MSPVLDELKYTSKKRAGHKFGFYLNKEDHRVYCLQWNRDRFKLENDRGVIFPVEDVDTIPDYFVKIDSDPAGIVGLIFSNVNGENLERQDLNPLDNSD